MRGAVGIDHVRERPTTSSVYRQREPGKNIPLKAQRDDIHHVDIRSQEEAGGGLVPQRDGGEGEGAPDVHGVAEDVEREALDAVVHEDAEVVAEEGACDAERVGGGDHERLAGGEERERDERVEGRGEERVLGLVLQGALEAIGRGRWCGEKWGGRMGRTASRGACLQKKCRARGSSTPFVRSLQKSV